MKTTNNYYYANEFSELANDSIDYFINENISFKEFDETFDYYLKEIEVELTRKEYNRLYDIIELAYIEKELKEKEEEEDLQRMLLIWKREAKELEREYYRSVL